MISLWSVMSSRSPIGSPMWVTLALHCLIRLFEVATTSSLFFTHTPWLFFSIRHTNETHKWGEGSTECIHRSQEELVTQYSIATQAEFQTQIDNQRRGLMMPDAWDTFSSYFTCTDMQILTEQKQQSQRSIMNQATNCLPRQYLVSFAFMPLSILL